MYFTYTIVCSVSFMLSKCFKPLTIVSLLSIACSGPAFKPEKLQYVNADKAVLSEVSNDRFIFFHGIPEPVKYWGREITGTSISDGDFLKKQKLIGLIRYVEMFQKTYVKADMVNTHKETKSVELLWSEDTWDTKNLDNKPMPYEKKRVKADYLRINGILISDYYLFYSQFERLKLNRSMLLSDKKNLHIHDNMIYSSERAVKDPQYGDYRIYYHAEKPVTYTAYGRIENNELKRYRVEGSDRSFAGIARGKLNKEQLIQYIESLL